MGLREWALRRALKTAIKRALKWLRESEMGWILTLLQGRKEILTAVIGAISLLLSAFGLMPEFVKALKPISDAVAAGDWKAALSAFVAAVALLMRAAWRAKVNRDEQPFDRDRATP